MQWIFSRCASFSREKRWACVEGATFPAELITWQVTGHEVELRLAEMYWTAEKRGGDKTSACVYIEGHQKSFPRPRQLDFRSQLLLWWTQKVTRDLEGFDTTRQNTTTWSVKTWSCRKCWMCCSATSIMVGASTALSVVSTPLFSFTFHFDVACLNNCVSKIVKFVHWTLSLDTNSSCMWDIITWWIINVI